ncbi:unnamed protein product, partial [Heterosigma akashiwo]
MVSILEDGEAPDLKVNVEGKDEEEEEEAQYTPWGQAEIELSARDPSTVARRESSAPTPRS